MGKTVSGAGRALGARGAPYQTELLGCMALMPHCSYRPPPITDYRHACTTNYLPYIRTPTLMLASRDDPFLG